MQRRGGDADDAFSFLLVMLVGGRRGAEANASSSMLVLRVKRRVDRGHPPIGEGGDGDSISKFGDDCKSRVDRGRRGAEAKAFSSTLVLVEACKSRADCSRRLIF